MHRYPRFVLAAGLLVCASLPCFAQSATTQSGAAAKPGQDLSSWKHVQNLPVKTKVHITTDHGGHTCRVFSVSDDALTCAKGMSANAAGTSYQRKEIQHIKLAHYVRSTLVGAGIGGGVGAISGGIAGRTKPCPTGQGFCLNGIGIGAGGVAAIFGVAGAVVGSVVGGTTDMARGSSIYVRP